MAVNNGSTRLTQATVESISKNVAEHAVRQTLVSIGLQVDDHIQAQETMSALRELAEMTKDPEYKADFVHLRKWRKSMEKVSDVSLKTAVGMFATGVISALWFIIKTWVER